MVSLETMRQDARAAFDAAIAAVQPHNLVPAQVETRDGRLHAGGETLPTVPGRRVVFSIGKAAPGLASAWLEAASGWAHEIHVLTPHGVPVPSQVEEVATIYTGAHPYPDEAGESSTRRLLEVADGLGRDDCLVVLLSGGGSALMAAAEDGLSLDDVHQTTSALLTGGADITEVNTVRRQLLVAAGGGLARRAHPASVQTLVLSDVLGDPLPDIASGPTVRSPSTADHALRVIDCFSLRERVPKTVISFLEDAADDPVDDGTWIGNASTRVIGNNRTAVEAAAASLAETGWKVVVEAENLVGEASERGVELAAKALQMESCSPCAAVYGGETTVTVRGSGRGGRNQELALAAALEMMSTGNTVLLSGGTDGIDGLSDNAGAVVDTTTAARLEESGIDPRAALSDNDSGTALETIGDAIRTGPTGTNVCDVTLVLTAPSNS